MTNLSELFCRQCRENVKLVAGEIHGRDKPLLSLDRPACNLLCEFEYRLLVIVVLPAQSQRGAFDVAIADATSPYDLLSAGKAAQQEPAFPFDSCVLAPRKHVTIIAGIVTLPAGS